LAPVTTIIRTRVCRTRVVYWGLPPERSSKRAYKITDRVMALTLISDARVAVYILLRISGKSKRPITLIPPNPTLITSSKKMIVSITGELMICPPFHTVHKLTASAAPAARVTAVLRATSWSKRVGPGRILTTAQIDRKIRHSAAKSHVSIMEYTYSVEYWGLSILPLWYAEYDMNENTI
jgi:hypothetical protein